MRTVDLVTSAELRGNRIKAFILIIILSLIFQSGMAIEKWVEAHIIVSKCRFP
jgi:hypothetical protein